MNPIPWVVPLSAVADPEIQGWRKVMLFLEPHTCEQSILPQNFKRFNDNNIGKQNSYLDHIPSIHIEI